MKGWWIMQVVGRGWVMGCLGVMCDWRVGLRA
jgi:hypothetical protein